jgi:hypothetical protein
MAGWGSPPASVTRGVFQGWGDSPLALDEDPIQGWWASHVADLAGSGTLTLEMAAAMLAEFSGEGSMMVLLDGDILVDGLSAKWYQSYLRSGVLSGDGSLSIEYIVKPVIAFNGSGDGTLDMTMFIKQIASHVYDGAGTLSMNMDYPTFAPSSTTFTASGTYTIPYWCRYIEVIALGGGGGGSGGYGSYFNGNGGGQGTDVAKFGTYTLTRGVDIPWTTATLSVTVGTGGAGGKGGSTIFDVQHPPDGLASGVSGTGLSFIGGAGGKGADELVTRPRQGLSPGNVTYNGIQYVGGGETTSSTAQVPGSGGYGGNGGLFSGGNGYAGGRGQVWIRAYQ